MKLLIPVVTALAIASASPAVAAPLTLKVLPASVHVVGDQFNVDVAVTDAVDLISWQFDLLFNKSVLNALSVSYGPFLESAGSTFPSLGGIDNSLGVVDSVADVLLAGSKSGGGVLASVTFKVIAPGSSPLTLQNPLFLDENFVDLVPVLQSGSVTAQPVPVPEPSLLMLTGTLTACAPYLARRRRRPQPRR